MPQNNILLRTFLKFSINKLRELKQFHLNSFPKVILTVNKSKVQTLASFNPNNNDIICYISKRLVADVFRSIAHELVHFAQNMNQELSQNSGDTGSDIENEANSLAGIIMREFGQKYPQIFVTSFDEIISKKLDNTSNNSKQIPPNVFPITEKKTKVHPSLSKYKNLIRKQYATTLSSGNIMEEDTLAEYGQNIIKKLFEKFRAENPNLTDEQLSYYINRFDQLKSSPKVTQRDILKYSFVDLEKLVDSFQTNSKIEKSNDSNEVEFSNTELVYNKKPLQIFHGDSPRQCVKIKGGFSATWCIARTAGNMYHGYRFAGTEPSFYFVKNTERLNKISQLSDDPYCFFVIQINNRGKYIVTNSLNDGDKEMRWSQILEIEPLLNGTDKLFVQKALSDDERADYARFKNGIEDDVYIELSYKDKQKYIAIRTYLTDNQFENTPNELLNDYISLGVALSTNQLKYIQDKRQLLKNYRRVTVTQIAPEYIKDRVEMGNRWSALSDDDIISIYKKFPKNLEEILIHKPNMSTFFKNEIDDFDGDNIRYILKYQPKLMSLFDNRLDELDKYDIIQILSHQPELISYFHSQISKFSGADIREILMSQPTLIEYTKEYLKKMRATDVSFTLHSQPRLIKYFEDRLSELDEDDIGYILRSQPQLAKYFEKNDLNELTKLDQPEEKEHTYKYGCLMLKLNLKNWNKFLEQIPDDKLYTEGNDDMYGKESEPHCTVLYGFSKNVDVNKIKKSLQTLKNPIKLSLDKINLFEHDKFDVVKFNVVSKELHKLNKVFKDNFENTQQYPKYEPHVTIAYVKKGFGKEFVQNLKQNIELESSEFEYSEPNGKKSNFGIDELYELTKIGQQHLDERNCEIKNKRKKSLDEYAQNILNKLAEKFRTENPNLTDEQLSYYINRFDQLKSSPKVTQKDILKYSFQDLEKLVDSFPTKMKSQPRTGTTNNDVEFSDGELIYNKPPLQLFHGDSPKRCIKIKGDFNTSWCIARTSGNMYHNYRFGNAEPSFYFVKNLERLNKIQSLNNDPYCFFVVQINNQGKYIVTSALNDGDKEMTWQQLVQIEPLLNGTDKLFVQKALSDQDKADYERFKDGLYDKEYRELSFEDKKRYISINNDLTDNQFENTPDELLNDYITMGAELKPSQLKFIQNKKPLLDNYRRITLKSVVPEFLNGGVRLGNRWTLLTDDMVDRILEKKKLSDMKVADILDVLKYHSASIKYFKNYLIYFTEDDIKTLLFIQPELITYFEKELSKFDSYTIMSILIRQPNLINYFENMLDKLTSNNMLLILIKHPKLIKYFKEYISKMNSGDKQELIQYHSELKKYFDKKSDIDELIELGEYFLTKNCDETYEDFDKIRKEYFLSECECDDIEDDEINELLNHIKKEIISEALYQGKTVSLNKPTQGDVKKFKVFVKNKAGKVIKVNFGSKDYNIKKNNPNRKKSYCARSKGIEGGGKDRTKANYWSRRQWNC